MTRDVPEMSPVVVLVAYVLHVVYIWVARENYNVNYIIINVFVLLMGGSTWYTDHKHLVNGVLIAKTEPFLCFYSRSLKRWTCQLLNIKLLKNSLVVKTIYMKQIVKSPHPILQIKLFCVVWHCCYEMMPYVCHGLLIDSID